MLNPFDPDTEADNKSMDRKDRVCAQIIQDLVS